MKSKNGFTLLIVLWGLGLISLLILSFFSNSRTRLLSSNNQANLEKVSLIADGLINLTSINLFKQVLAYSAQPNQSVYDNKPRFCSFDNASASISIASEDGKLDLNFVSREILVRIFLALGLKQDQAERISDNVIEFRTEKTGLNKTIVKNLKKPFPPKNASFETVMELDQVEGIDQALFKKIFPLFTVHSKNIGLDPLTAPPALFVLLTGAKPDVVEKMLSELYSNSLNRYDTKFPSELKSTGNNRVFMIHVEVMLPTEQTIARDAVIELNLDAGWPYTIKEIRRGKSFYLLELRNFSKKSSLILTPCV